ncbi:hypothetical protein BVC80_1037g36 [Macleaya cordata]|uniref:Uncharacterized protein n=1 Tax=Macleaya cordata TaxID=56857 RepID=A0A200QVM7_MACCD|nr:hypothetical protein BVC80_1037g36 [Macleaya cordata]
MVLEEEQQQRCSNSSSGGGSRISKKLKQKKIPQRGLGVAQLEKIRLEEQQKKEASVFVPLPHQSSSISFPPPCPSNLSSSSSLFRSSSIPFSNFDLFIPPPPPPPLPTTTFYPYNTFNPPEGGENGGSGYSSAMGNPCELDGVGPKLDPRFAFRSTLPNDLNPTWPCINIQGKQQQQPPSSKVNVSISTSTSSGLNFQMEPPSNQSYCSNYLTSQLWPEEEKMVGMKRPWPFSLDNRPGSSFQFPQFGPQICRLDESSSCVNGGVFNFEPGNTIFREVPSNSAPLEWRGSSSELKSKKGTKETGSLDGKFLTLGPPPTSSSSTSSKAKQPLVFPATHHREFVDFDMPPYQVYNEDPFFGSSGTIQQQQPYYSFLPPKGQQIGRLTSKSNEQRGKVGEGLDLNLRL